ncbi:NAD(P)-binding protein [Xylaria venustula]|nr:NAD(P)-binding protein [Xylaria venustula]
MDGRRILIVGANRGIGLNLVKAFKHRGWTVFGSFRPQTQADTSMQDLRATGATLLEIEFTDEDTIIKSAEAYGSEPLDVLVNCGGVNIHPESWTDHTADIINEEFRIMATGPFLTSKHFLPALKKSKFGLIVNISSKNGSMTRNAGRLLAYRMAKAALNAQTVTLSQEFKKAGENIAVISMNPGFVSTRINNWKFEDDMDTCIAGLVRNIEGATMENSGQFINWDGSIIPW